jgi:8-oxo-dGTP pyrophosphatase MutT (NUDIX family)
LDRESRVLLLRAIDPADASKPAWWELPGGGIEGDESSEEAATREVFEETGLQSVEMGPCVWLQHVTFDFGGYHFDQHERIHVAWCDGGQVRPAALEALEAVAFQDSRWWPMSELATSADPFIPVWLPELLPTMMIGDLPPDPIDLGHL